MTDHLNYSEMMQASLRNLVMNVMKQIESDGLPGDHHFYITFSTKHNLVKISKWLKEKHPTEMTIVIQNWFDELSVDNDRFKITLNFGDQLEELTIPFTSIISFVDPSVEFGLKFEEQKETKFEKNDEAEMVTLENEEKSEAEIVSLDSFRK